jgi:hypothetical protein
MVHEGPSEPKCALIAGPFSTGSLGGLRHLRSRASVFMIITSLTKSLTRPNVCLVLAELLASLPEVDYSLSFTVFALSTSLNSFRKHYSGVLFRGVNPVFFFFFVVES